VLLALDLGATVVAEGVERPQDLVTLSDLGVHAAQGNLLGKPSTNRSDLERWLRLPGGGDKSDLERATAGPARRHPKRAMPSADQSRLTTRD
jgi:predicted signal transduction protein with EAL and GGDEF domain